DIFGEMPAMPEHAADLGLGAAPARLEHVLQALCLRWRQQHRDRVRLVAVAELRNEVAMLAALCPIVEVPGEIPGRPPLVEAGEQPFLQAVAPFQMLDFCALLLLP